MPVGFLHSKNEREKVETMAKIMYYQRVRGINI